MSEADGGKGPCAWVLEGPEARCEWGDDEEQWCVTAELMEEPEKPVLLVELLALATLGAMAPAAVPAIVEAPRGWSWGVVVECGGVLAQVRVLQGSNEAPGYSMPPQWRWARGLSVPAVVEALGRAAWRLQEGTLFLSAAGGGPVESTGGE